MTDAVVIGDGRAVGENSSYQPEGIQISALLPFSLQDGTFSGLYVNDEEKKYVISGKTVIGADYWNHTHCVEKALRVESFATTDDSELVQVDLSEHLPSGKFNRAGMLSRAAATANRELPALLWDTGGTAYRPIGYIYFDESGTTICFEPSEPFSDLLQFPVLKRNHSEQQLTLIFRVKLGIQIDRLTIGKVGLAVYDPPFACDIVQKSR